MPRYIRLENQKIAYHRSSSHDDKIVLIHGNSGSGTTFRKQLDSSLGQKVGLIAIDLPGHGNSDPASTKEQYSLRGYAQVLLEALDNLKINKVILVGWSLGGHIAMQTSELSARVKGLMTFGSPPLNLPLEIEPAFFPHKAIQYVFKKNLSEEDAREFADAFVGSQYSGELGSFVQDIIRTDRQARPELGNSITAGDFGNERDIVSRLKIPLAILHGKEEKLVNRDYYRELTIPTLWRNEVQVVDGAGHAIHWEQPETFNAYLEDFITDCAF